ncbi:MAG: PAS domain S-box protein [Balneolales bacterium]
MKTIQEVKIYRYLILGSLGLLIVAMATLYIWMELKEPYRTLHQVNKQVYRLQTEASMHLANYTVSGHVRDIQRFRSVSFLIIELTDAIRQIEDREQDQQYFREIFEQMGFSEQRMRQSMRLRNRVALFPFLYEGLEVSGSVADYQSQLMDVARRLLRDHVNDLMIADRYLDYLRELQNMNLENQAWNEEFENVLDQKEKQFDFYIILFLSGVLVFGFLFIGYMSYNVENSWKRYEESLIRSRNRYQEMFEQAGIGIAQTKTDGKPLWVNSAVARILGYSSVEDMYRRVKDFRRIFVEPERLADFNEAMRINGYVKNFMFQAFQKEGTKIWLLSNSRTVKDEQGQIVCYEGSYQDYTLYLKTNQELQYLTTVLRGMVQSIYQLLPDMKFDKAINEFLKIIGLASAADRAYLFRNEKSGFGRLSELKYEWVRVNSLKSLHKAVNKNIRLDKLSQDLAKRLTEGEVVQIVSNNLDEGPLQSFLKKQKTRVMMLVPVQVEGRLWGMIGLGNCSNDDQWPEELVQIMKTLASALGHYILKREMEQSILESENRYRTLVGNIREIVFQIDGNGVIDYLNSSWETITGYQVSESIGRKLTDFVHLDEREILDKSFRRMVKKEEGFSNKEYRLTTKEGDIRWLEWSCKVITDKQHKSPHIYGTLYDLTERKNTEFTMEQNSQRLQALIESSPLMISSLDTYGRLTLWNRAAEKNFGWNRNEVIGKPPPHVPPHLKEQYFALLDRVLAGEYIYGIELERRRKNGSVIYISMSAAPLYDIDGRVEQVITFSQDINEAKISKEAIKKSLREKDVLHAEIHHRVKNNMAVISGMLSLKAQEQTDPKIITLLKDSENRIRSMSMIHERLYQMDTFAEIDFGAYLKELAIYTKNYFGEYDVPVETTVEAEGVYLEITQAIPCGLLANELLTNGYKHAFDNRSKGNIQLSFKRQGDYLELLYQDNGKGLPKEVISQKSNYSLGMNLIWGLSQQLKGDLEIRNNKGTYIRLLFKEL